MVSRINFESIHALLQLISVYVMMLRMEGWQSG